MGNTNEVVRVRAKMRCTEIHQRQASGYGPRDANGQVSVVPRLATTFTLVPVSPQGDEGSENHLFASQSPSGKFELTVLNDAAAAMFRPGDTFYVDISRAPAE